MRPCTEPGPTLAAAMRAIAVLALGTLGPRAAAAEADAPGVDRVCARAGQPWIALAFAGEAWSAEQKAAVLADLRAGLLLRGISVCPLGTQGSEPPLALLELGTLAEGRVAVGIELHDALTAKRVLRDVDVRELGEDARALAIAEAADELLRASWAELALTDAPAPSREPPPAVERAVTSSLGRAQQRGSERWLAARGVLAYAGGGSRAFGGELALGAFLGQRVGAELALGFDQGLDELAPHGSVSSRALSAAGSALIALAGRGRTLSLAGELGLVLASVRMRGASANASARATEGDGLDLHARAGFLARVELSALLALRADAGVGFPLASVEALDAGKQVVSTGGLQLFAALGAEVSF